MNISILLFAAVICSIVGICMLFIIDNNKKIYELPILSVLGLVMVFLGIGLLMICMAIY